MSCEIAPRGFVLPMMGLVLLFAVLGPPIGAGLFVPLAVVLRPPAGADTLTLLVFIAALVGHTVGLIAAYVIGVGPAAATGFVYALWDAAAPERAPRALGAAFIGGLITYGVALRLSSLAAPFELTIHAYAGSSIADWTDATFSGRIDAALREAFVACGAVAALVCAFAASLLGLTMRPGARPPLMVRRVEASDMADAPRRLVSADKRPEDEAALRPQTLADFTGQEAARKNLKVFIDRPRARGEALDHVLFVGPPGLGKTTLAQIVARELGVNFRSTSGPVIAKAGDLAAQLTNLEARDVLFIDEIHRLNPAVEEILYPAMEDFQLDLIIGEGPAARSVKIDLPNSP